LDPVEAELDGWVGPDSDLLLWLHVEGCPLPHDGVDGKSPFQKRVHLTVRCRIRGCPEQSAANGFAGGLDIFRLDFHQLRADLARQIQKIDDGAPDAGKRRVRAGNGSAGDVVELEETMFETVAGLLGGRVRVMVAVEDDLLADLLSHDLLPSRPGGIIG